MAPFQEEEAVSDEDSDEVTARDGVFALFSAVGENRATLLSIPNTPLNGRLSISKRRPDGWRAVSTRSGSVLKTWKRTENEVKGGRPPLLKRR
jgi:hypothetical protein